jgi:hypothetical protein
LPPTIWQLARTSAQNATRPDGGVTTELNCILEDTAVGVVQAPKDNPIAIISNETDFTFATIPNFFIYIPRYNEECCNAITSMFCKKALLLFYYNLE